jgi:hypothetical protein
MDGQSAMPDRYSLDFSRVICYFLYQAESGNPAAVCGKS